VDQAQAVAADVEACAGANGSGHPSREKSGIDALFFVKTPDARADFRGRTERRPGQERPLRGLHAHRLAGVATALGQGRFEEPGVAAQERALLAFLDAYHFHGLNCRAFPGFPSAPMWLEWEKRAITRGD
jgi:hypothetical protein